MPDFPLNDCESAVPSVLHQDTSLISGTLRLCLDPTGKFTDAQLWQILHLLELQGIKVLN